MDWQVEMECVVKKLVICTDCTEADAQAGMALIGMLALILALVPIIGIGVSYWIGKPYDIHSESTNDYQAIGKETENKISDPQFTKKIIPPIVAFFCGSLLLYIGLKRLDAGQETTGLLIASIGGLTLLYGFLGGLLGLQWL